MATLDEVKARRKELRKGFRAILNNDGNAISFYRTEYGYPVTEQAFINYKWGAHRGVPNEFTSSPTPSDITTFVFNAGYSGYTYYKSDINDMLFGSGVITLGPVPGDDPGRAINAIYDETGKDALQVSGEFFKNEPVEFFFEARVNDRHTQDYPREDLTPIKQTLWDQWGLLDNGVNNGFDFENQYAYDTMLSMVLEVVQDPKWKINGVCLNFYRHFGLFKNSVGFADTKTSQAQIDRITGWVNSINDAMNERSKGLMDEGKEPLLLMIKAADHPDFNKAVAVDIEDWLKSDIVDIFVPYGYHQFSFIRDAVALGKKYGASVCPSIPDSRVSSTKERGAASGMRARIMQVLGSGADGVEFFNLDYATDFHSPTSIYRPSGELWRNIGYNKAAAWGDRRYYQTYTNQSGYLIGTAARFPGENFFPNYTGWVSEDNPKREGEFLIEIYENSPSSVQINIYTEGTVTSASVNGSGVLLAAEPYGYSAVVDPSSLLSGINRVSIEGAEVVINDIEIQVT